MFQNTNPQKWAERLALAQNARDELVRLLGLINTLNNIVSNEASLQAGARKIVATLANYLNLMYCGLYIKTSQEAKLEAFSGQAPQEDLAEWLLLKVQEGITFSTRLREFEDRARLNCMPIFNGETQMGAMAIISPYQMDEANQRHFKLVMDSVTPVIETFLLRNQLLGLEQDLQQLTHNVASPDIPLQAQPAKPHPGQAAGIFPGQTPSLFLIQPGC